MLSLLAETLRASGFTVDTARSVAAARERIDRFDPDMLLLDISLGNGPTGVHLAHALEITRPDIAILFLTRHPDAASANAEGLSLPTHAGFLRKHMVHDKDYLLAAIESVFAERAADVRQDRVRGDGLDSLSEQALRVLRLLAEGYSNAEIARRMELSEKSVERWLDTIYRELGLKRGNDVNLRVEAVKRYYLAVGIPVTGGR